MKTNEWIIKYLDNQLTSEEKISFDKQLESSDEFKREFENFLLFKKKIDTLKEIKLKSDYTDTILPEFHKNYQGKKPESIRKALSYAFGLIVMIIVSVAVLRIFFNNTSKVSGDLEKFTQSLDDNEKLDLLTNLSSNDDVYSIISGKEFVDMLEKDLVVNSKVMENYDISYQDIIGSLSKSEADKIYNEILKQNILEEVPL